MKKYGFLCFIFISVFVYSQDYKQDSLNHLLQQAKQNNAWKSTISLLYNKGTLFFKERNFDAAQKQFLIIDSIAKQHNYIDENTVKALLDRANISKNTFTQDGTETANALGDEALRDAEKINNETLIYLIYRDLSYIKDMKGDHAEAKRMMDLAFQYYLKKDDVKSVSRLYKFYGSHYKNLDSIEKLESVRKDHLQYLRTHNDSVELANALRSLGDFYGENFNQWQKAMPYLQESKTVFENIKLTKSRPYLYLIESLAISHADNKEYQLGYEYYKQAYQLRKDVVREANDVTTRQLEAKYQAKDKEQQINLLKSKNELIEQQKINQRNLLLGGLGLTTIAGLFFFFLFRNKQKTTKKLKELDAFKSRLFANISHEFRTPLTLISGPIEKRLNSESLTDNERSEFSMIQRNSNRLLNLVNQLLDLSKLESGYLKLKVGQGDLSVLLKSMASSFQHRAIQKSIDYNVDINDMHSAWFDKDVIEKVVINLLSNAFKYTPNHGIVNFKAALVDEKVRLYFENNSQQLTKDQIENIFNRFYQVEENTEGVGIGLSLVKELVTLSHGDIEVKNVSDNRLVFKIHLPILKSQFHPDELIEDSIEASDFDHKPLILEMADSEEDILDEDLPILLIVDDHEDIRTFIKSAFKKSYQVVEAIDGAIGVEKAIDLVPDVIISDVMMPNINGFELASQLKQDERTSHIPILLLTAKVEDADKFIGLETGADDYITKPFKIKELELRVKNLIDSRENLRNRYSQELVLRPKDIAVTNLDEKFLEKLQEILDKRITDSSFNVQDFSEAVHMSRMQLHRKLKALTGLSARDFLRSQRLKLAASLLEKSDVNISEIVYMVGFNDHSYFTKCFKDAYGCSPTEYASKY